MFNFDGDFGSGVEEIQGDEGIPFSDGLADNKVIGDKDECHRGNKGEFRESDIVWGKVRSYLWWPGQICDPSDSLEEDMKFKKEDCFLIRYFGQRCVWTREKHMKPFLKFFSQMEKKSNSKAFCYAVNFALDEVSRRVELGLSCSCLPQEVYNRIKSRGVDNVGIERELSKRDGGDTSLDPEKLVQNVNQLALGPFSVTDQLEFTTARAQLLAFKRWKGYPELELCDELMGDDNVQVPSENGNLDTLKGKPVNLVSTDLIAKKTSSPPKKLIRGRQRKGKIVSGQGSIPDMLSQLSLAATDPEDRKLPISIVSFFSNFRNSISLENSNSPKLKEQDHEERVLFEAEGEKTVSTVEVEAELPDGLLENNEQVSFEEGELPDGFLENNEQVSSEKGNSEKLFGEDISKIAEEGLSSQEMLPELCLAAINPLEGCSFLNSSASFFSNFRNSISLENPDLQNGDNWEHEKKELFDPEREKSIVPTEAEAELLDGLLETNKQVLSEKGNSDILSSSLSDKKEKAVDFGSNELNAKKVKPMDSKSFAEDGCTSQDMLSQLCLSATKRLKGCSALNSTLSFFSNFRNLISSENSSWEKVNQWGNEEHKLLETETENSIPIVEAEAELVNLLPENNEQVSSEKGNLDTLTGQKRKAVDCASTELSAKKICSRPIEGLSSQEILSQVCKAAMAPLEGFSVLNSSVTFFSNFRNSICLENSSLQKVKEGNHEKQVLLLEPEKEENIELLNCKQEVNLESEAENTLDNLDEKYKDFPIALVLKFKDLDAIPSVLSLNDIFGRYGPLNESETQVLNKSKRVKVVFKRRSDAEIAFNSARKFSTMFGTSLVSYRLRYYAAPRPKTSTLGRKRRNSE